jgi:hypothetical protein
LALSRPVAQLSYEVSRALGVLFPTRHVFETDSSSFDLAKYLEGTRTEHTLRREAHPQITSRFCDARQETERMVENAVYDVRFQGEALTVVVLTFSADDVCETRSFVVAETETVARRFFEHVCAWLGEVRGEILVYEGGSFKKDEELFAVVQAARLDALILKGTLKEDITDDVATFFRRREEYARFGVPHKRGILLYGPPGNGKTHFLKALLREMQRPCLYVKSLQGTYGGGHDGIRRVFARARKTAPCFLVLEDLETIVTDDNRSFFLNELDGFADNSGLVTIATTNFPERIDPAIVDRPSRFDRKYLFDLPGIEERTRFLARWSDGLTLEMQLGTEALRRIAEATAGFSFAYLKELCVSSLMRWMDGAEAGSMDAVMEKQVGVLDEQVRRGKSPGKRDGRRVGLVPEA